MRRILFAAIGAMLLISFVIGSSTPSEPMIGGTIFYFVITGISLVVAAWNSVTTLDRETGILTFQKRFAGIAVRSESTQLGSITGVVLQIVQFMKESEQPQPTMLNTRYRSYMNRRNTYYRLYLETGDEKFLIEDSSDSEDLDRVGETVADFLGLTYRRIEI